MKKEIEEKVDGWFWQIGVSVGAILGMFAGILLSSWGFILFFSAIFLLGILLDSINLLKFIQKYSPSNEVKER